MEVWAPVITPYRTDGGVDLDGYIENLHKLARWGLTGALLCGSSGEFPHLTFEERREILVRSARERPEGFRLLAHAGGLPFPDVRRLVETAAHEDYEAALVITPYYFVQETTPLGLKRYYDELLRAGPVMIYHYPQQTGVDLSPQLVGELASSGVIGIKDTSGSAPFLAATIAATPPSFRAYGGLGGSFLAALTQGAKGGILALSMVAPSQCLELASLVEEGRIDEARELQSRLVPLAGAVGAQHGIAGLKWAAGQVGLVSSSPRPPLVRLNADGRVHLARLLEEIQSGSAG